MNVPRQRRFPYRPMVTRLGDIEDPSYRAYIGTRIFGKRYGNLMADDETREVVLSVNIGTIATTWTAP